MGASKHANAKNLPIPFEPKVVNDLAYHEKHWTSGQRGGGYVPLDFTWGTNPKQHQEERGAAEADAPKDEAAKP
jgi:hypothetical protein